MELIIYSFIVREAKCRVGCNTINQLHAEICDQNKVKRI